MANTNIDNSKKISELATTTNVASTDRFVVLYNAISNAAIANGTPQVRTITVDNFTSNLRYANTTAAGIIKVGNYLSINATGYLTINSVPIDLTSISSDIIPSANNSYSLGNTTNQWKDLHVSSNTIYIGGTPLSVNNGTLLVNNNPVSSNDAAQAYANAVAYANLIAANAYSNAIAYANLLVANVNTGNVVFTQYNAPWSQTYPVITTKVQSDLNILGNNAPVNISSDQYVQLVYSEDQSPYGGGNNQSYYWTSANYNGQYVQAVNSAVNSSAWTEKDYWANGAVDIYGVFSNNDYNFNYSYSFSPSYKANGYGLDIKPFGGFNNTLTVEPTADYDIHLYESATNGAITLGNYGQTNLRVYGPGGANNGGGQYGNDVRADLVGNSIFNITTNNGAHTWTIGSDGSFTTAGNVVTSNAASSLGSTTAPWYQVYSQYFSGTSAAFVSVSSPTDFTLQAGSESYSFGANGVLTVPSKLNTTFASIAQINGINPGGELAIQSAGIHNWKFASDGATSFPNPDGAGNFHSEIYTQYAGNQTILETYDTSNAQAVKGKGPSVILDLDFAGLFIQSWNGVKWAFDSSGAILFPNDTLQRTAYTGDAATLGGNTSSDLRNYSDTISATAYSNAITYASDAAANAYSNAVAHADTISATAYSNATSYADTKAATAYTNATAYTDTKAANAYSNAIAYSGNAAQAYSNATSYADTKAATAYSNAVSYANSTFQTSAGLNANIASYLVDGTNKVITGNTITLNGNVVVNGNTSYFVANNTIYSDALIELHAPGSNASNTWTFDDGKDVGIRLHYYNGGDKNAALVLADDTKYLEWYIDGSENANGVFIGTYGTIKANVFLGTATSANNSTYLSGNTVSDLNTYSDNKAANAYANAIAYSGNAAQAYANATSYADNKAANAYSNAIAYSGNAAQAYSNATTYASNATNITSGTLNTARLPTTANISTAVNVGANINISTSQITVGNATVNTVITSTNISGVGTGITNVNAATVGGNTASDLRTYTDNKAANAYSNAIAYSGNAAQAYSNAVTYVGAQSFVNTSQLTSNLSNYVTTSSLTNSITIGNTAATLTLVGTLAAPNTSTTASSVGYLGIPQNGQSTAYGVAITDNGKHIYMTSSNTVTIPANANVAFPIGTTITFVSGPSVTTSIAITSDTMYLAANGATGTRTLAQYGMATAVKVANTTWYINGSGLT